ncbi:hypothetical protein AB6A40_006662 [Gnathostoma spinigerum]|uniref:D-lactate dehydrogenase (cytochrome) n=1 Tax=Gnathostoma spinigerum TaxID=75299 RepID=A0ABD6EJ82_9BILA
MWRTPLRWSSTSVKKGIENTILELERLLGADKIKTTASMKDQHSHDESHHRVRAPDVVVLPGNVEEVSGVLRFCNQNKISVVPFGAGTGLEGGTVPVKGGVSLDVMSMNEIVEINAEDFDCTVQCGVTRNTLNKHLHETGLWFPVDPGADASLGGMISTCASGTNAMKYGTMLQNVLNLEVVLPNGEVMYTHGKGKRAKKSAAGYNLTSLFVGSEGTLGVITEATIRLHARPNCISTAICSFPSVYEAVASVVNVLQCSIPVARIEFLDKQLVMAINRFSHTSLTELPTLMLEFQGMTNEEVKVQADLIGEICSDNKGSDFMWSYLPEEMEQLWKARHNAYYAIVAQRKGCNGFSTDVCVPISKLAEVITAVRKDIDESGLLGCILGHVGDGNFHCMFPVNESDEMEVKAIWNLSDKIVKRALAANGTCTGEHGIGLGKRRYLVEEIGENGIKAMRTIKEAFDPNFIMNPGKIFL